MTSIAFRNVEVFDGLGGESFITDVGVKAGEESILLERCRQLRSRLRARVMCCLWIYRYPCAR